MESHRAVDGDTAPNNVAFATAVVPKSSTLREASIMSFDSIVTFVAIGWGTVSYWRGTWNVLDIYLYPDDLETSAWVSLGISAAIILTCHALRKVLLRATNRLAGAWRAILERLFTYFAGWGVVCSWRGIWYIWNVYILPDDPVASAWLSHGVGIALLLACLSLRCIYAPPGVVMMDDEEGAFVLDTLRSYWQRREANGQRMPVFKAKDCRVQPAGLALKRVDGGQDAHDNVLVEVVLH